jgi:hypothetical protein
MTAPITATVKEKRLELDVPVDWPDGTEVQIHPLEREANGEGDRTNERQFVPSEQSKEDLDRRFHALVGQWKEGTRFLSSIHEMVSHPAYLQIIGMGQQALPLLINELRREPDHWFVALQAITGTNPIPPSARGNVDAMSRAWLDWAERRGL